jgi:serine protease Do
MARSAQWTLSAVGLLGLGAIGGYIAVPALQGQAVPATNVPKEHGSYRDIVKRVLPGVVSIDSRIKQPVHVEKDKDKADKPGARRHPNFEGKLPPGVPEEFRKFFEQMPDQEMPDQPHGGFGSGFIVDAKGVILTNNHVVDGAEQVEVQLQDGRKFLSKEIIRDPKTDLAIVKVDAKGALPFLELGDSDQMEIGDRVLAMGAPFGLTGSVTSGIISAKGRNGLSMNMYEDFLQTDAAINPGNSGGPLINLDGKVIGIDSAIKTQSGGFQGVGLAISSNMAKNVMTQLLKDGVVHRGYLGVQIKDLIDKDVAERLGAKDGGVLVGSVFEKSPAAKAGVQAGDVITSLNGKMVKDGRELQRAVASLPLDKPADLNVVRDGKPQTLKVTVEEQPNEFGNARVPVQKSPRPETSAVNVEKLGVDVADLTQELADQYGFKGQAAGALVTRVEHGSLAEEAGLRKGTLIVKVDKEPVATAAAFKTKMEQGSLDKGVLLQVETPQGGTAFVLVKAAAATTK